MEGSNIQQPHENWQSWEHWQELKRIRQKEYTDEVEHLIKEWGDEVRSKQKEFLQGYERGFYLAPFSMAPSEFDGFLTKSRNNFHEAILQPITENILRRIRLAGEAHCQGQKSIQFEYSRAITPNAGPNNGHLSTAISTSPQKSGLNAGGAAGMASQAPKTQVSAPQPALNAESLPTPTSTISPTADEHARPTNPPVKFEDVFQNGQAQHRIVEAFRGEWYIVKCDEHKKYFTGERPLQGAAKHLDSLAHDFIQPRNQDRALRLLGHRVIGCDKDLAARNNSLLPYKKSSTESRASDIAKTPSGASAKLSLKTPGRGVALIAHGASESSEDSNVEPPSEWISDAGGLITKPKTFHIYWAFYRENLRDDPKLWPVLILGWDDLTPGGLQGDLVGTGLLDDPVPLRGYKVRSNAIVGWAKGFEDDGPRVTQRRFPVMFFDERQCVGWVAPRDLRKFPIHIDNPPDRHDHPINAARRWILKKDGFESWDAFEKAYDQKQAEKAKQQVPRKRDELSPVHGAQTAESPASSPEASTVSKTSDGRSPSSASEDEYQRLLQTAGEIPGDDDYQDSDEDSTLSIEREEWDEAQNKDRPWTFYGLRDMGNKEPAVRSPQSTAPQSRFKEFAVQSPQNSAPQSKIKGSAIRTPQNNTRPKIKITQGVDEDALSTQLKVAMASARILSARACSEKAEADEPSNGKPSLVSPKASSSEPQPEASLSAMPTSTLPGKPSLGKLSLSMTSTAQTFQHSPSASDDVANDKFSSILRPGSQPRHQSRDRSLPVGNEFENNRGQKRSWPEDDDGANRSPASQGVRDEQTKKARITRSESKDSDRATKQEGSKLSNSLLLEAQKKESSQTQGIRDEEAKRARTAQSESKDSNRAQDQEGLNLTDNVLLGAQEKQLPKAAKVSTMVEAVKATGESSDAVTTPSADSIEQTASKTDTVVKDSPAEPAFTPRLPVQMPLYEVAKYEKGSAQWTREGLGSLLGLYPSFDSQALGTVGGDLPVQIVIRPKSLKAISGKQIPGANGNYELTLISDNASEASMKLIFDRSETNKKFVDPPVIQVRKFRRWLESVNKNIKSTGG